MCNRKCMTHVNTGKVPRRSQRGHGKGACECKLRYILSMVNSNPATSLQFLAKNILSKAMGGLEKLSQQTRINSSALPLYLIGTL